MGRKPLTDREKEDAGRLRSVWDRYRGDMTQEEIAAKCGWTQGAFNGYMLARTRLNIEAVLRISKALGVAPDLISPGLCAELLPAPAQQLVSVNEATTPYRDPHLDIDVTQLERIIGWVEEVCERLGKHPTPRRKARLIALIYGGDLSDEAAQKMVRDWLDRVITHN